MFELGGLLIAAAIVLLVLLPPIFQAARPPRWSTLPLACELIAVLIVSLLAIGLACLIHGAFGLILSGTGFIHLAVLLAIALATIVALRRPRTRALHPDAAS